MGENQVFGKAARIVLAPTGGLIRNQRYQQLLCQTEPKKVEKRRRGGRESRASDINQECSSSEPQIAYSPQAFRSSHVQEEKI